MTEKEVIEIMKDKFKTENIEKSMNIKKDFNIDSITMIEFVMELEDSLNIEIPDEDLQKFETVEDVVNYFANK